MTDRGAHHIWLDRPERPRPPLSIYPTSQDRKIQQLVKPGAGHRRYPSGSPLPAHRACAPNPATFSPSVAGYLLLKVVVARPLHGISALLCSFHRDLIGPRGVRTSHPVYDEDGCPGPSEPLTQKAGATSPRASHVENVCRFDHSRYCTLYGRRWVFSPNAAAHYSVGRSMK